jgi:peptide/nickel transport system substrate-binding protein
MKKAGYANYKFQLHCNPRFPYSDEAILYKEHAAKAGINVEIVKHPEDGYGSHVWNNVPWCTTYWSGRPTVDQMFANTYAGDAPWNDTRFNHERFNRLLKEGRLELEENKRKEIYFEMQKILRNEGGVVVPLFSAWLDAVRDNVKHSGNLAGDHPLDGFKAPERWWFA